MNWSDELLSSTSARIINERVTIAQCAKELTESLGEYIHPEQLRGALRRYNARADREVKKSIPYELVNREIPDNLVTVSEEPLYLPKADFLYASDFHTPFHDRVMVERLIYVGNTVYPHIRTLIIGGDFWDMSAASTYTHDEAEPISIEEELRVGGDLIYELMRHWDHIYWLSGNHDERIRRRLGAAFNLERLIYAALGGRFVPGCEMHVSNYDWMTAGDNWLMGHPSNFSGRGGQVPTDIALMRQRNCIGAHNHRYGIQATTCGSFIGVDPGCMTTGSLHWYKQRRLNKFNEWVSGFVVVDNGYLTPYPAPWTDWKKLGCE